jgi:site-specific DNA-methyltransferase (adenine-specific)
MKIDATTFAKLPEHLQAIFIKAPNPGSDEVLDAFPQAKGQQGAVSGDEPSSKTNAVYGQFNGRPATTPRGDSGSAARFFYCAKSSKRDRDEGLEGFEAKNNMRVNGPRESEDAKTATLRANIHPTVKPTDLMRYLCRLVTPPGGVVLDPFMGSGSTGKAAMLEGFQFIGCELSPEYFEIAKARIEAAKTEPTQKDMFVSPK